MFDGRCGMHRHTIISIVCGFVFLNGLLFAAYSVMGLVSESWNK